MLSIFGIMKGVRYIIKEQNRRTALVIDLKFLKTNYGEVQNLLEGVLAESRKKDAKIPISSVIKRLKKKGKLQ